LTSPPDPTNHDQQEPRRSIPTNLSTRPTVNTVLGKRFAKKQQMQWTRRGAHLLLQTRTRALDGTLRATFERWYPGLANDNAANTDRAAAA
jgi:hypothetical protein